MKSLLVLTIAAQSGAFPDTLLQFLPIAVFLLIVYLLFRRQLAAGRANQAAAAEKPSFNWRGVILIAIAFVLIGLARLFHGPEPSPELDRAKVVSTMESMFAAATSDDMDKWHAIAAPDFYAFDNGKKFEGDALMNLIKTLHGQGRTYRWQITQPEVHINHDFAWITYLNRGSMQDANGSKDMSWLESAILQRGKDGWRIRFFHSTRVP